MNNAGWDATNQLNALSPSPPGANGPFPPEVQHLATLYTSVARSISWLQYLWAHADLEPSGTTKKRRGEGTNWESTIYIDIGTETTALQRDIDTLENDPASPNRLLLYELFSIVEMRFFVPESLRSLVFANLQSDCLLVVRMPSVSWTNGYWTRSDVLLALAREIIAASNGFGGLDNYLLNLMAGSIRHVLVSGFLASLINQELEIHSSDLSGWDNYGRQTRRQVRRFDGIRRALVFTQLDSNGIDGCIGVSLFAPNDSAAYKSWPSLSFLLRIRRVPPPAQFFSNEFLIDALNRYSTITDE